MALPRRYLQVEVGVLKKRSEVADLRNPDCFDGSVALCSAGFSSERNIERPTPPHTFTLVGQHHALLVLTQRCFTHRGGAQAPA